MRSKGIAIHGFITVWKQTIPFLGLQAAIKQNFSQNESGVFKVKLSYSSIKILSFRLEIPTAFVVFVWWPQNVSPHVALFSGPLGKWDAYFIIENWITLMDRLGSERDVRIFHEPSTNLSLQFWNFGYFPFFRRIISLRIFFSWTSVQMIF